MTLSSAVTATAAPWTCHKCTTTNDPSRLRCSACQGWKGGHREGYSHRTTTTTTTSPVTSTLLSHSNSAAAAKHGRRASGSAVPNVGTTTSSGPLASKLMVVATHKSKGSNSRSCRSNSSMPRTKRMKAEEATTSSSTILTDHSHTTTTTTLKRKSAISRRPRLLRPTEKMIAFMNDAKEEKMVKSNHHQQKQQRKRKADDMALDEDANSTHRSNSNKKYKGRQASSSTTTTTISTVRLSSSWLCSRCSTINLPTKSRCSSCQGWKGGKREGLAHSHKSRKNSASRKQHSPIEGGKEKKTKIAKSSSAASAAIAIGTVTTRGVHDNGVSPTSLLVGSGGENVEHFDQEEDAASESFEDVVCCLCKCAVDFSDRAYFLPPRPTKDGMNSIANGKSVDDNRVEEVRESTNVDDSSKEQLCIKTSPASADAPPSCLEVEEAKTNGTEGSETSNLTVDNGRQSCEQIKAGSTTNETSVDANNMQLKNNADNDNDESKPSFQLPYRFYDPTNALILCDGPAYARKNKRQEYKCERAFHQHCHFVPVLSVPRGPWRCLICKYHDEMYLKEMASKKKGSPGREESDVIGGMKMSNSELNAIFRCHSGLPTSCISSLAKDEVVNNDNECARKGLMTAVTEETCDVNASSLQTVSVDEAQLAKQQLTQCPSAPDEVIRLEQRFEAISAPLKSHLLHTELTTRSRSVIKTSLATIRIAEHSLRSITETSKARKALAERVESVEMGLPQELCQSVMRIALCKTRIRDMIFSLENVIQSRPVHHDGVNVPMMFDLKSNSERDDEVYDVKLDAQKNDDARIDPISDLMQWCLLRQGCYAKTTNDQANSFAPTITNATTISGGMTNDDGESLLNHLFPQGNISRRRSEPRTGEAHIQHVKNHVNEEGEGNSVTSISLEDLVCWTCHGTDATDENDMLLCDGMHCCRAFHMKCLEPKLSLDDVHKTDDDNWFCPLCTAHATLIHSTQCEYLGDDLEDSPMSTSKKVNDNGRLNFGNRRIKEWETAKDVFAEAPFEVRIAQKFKENIRDEETAQYLAQELGIVTRSNNTSSERGIPSGAETNNFNVDWEDDGSDEDFDNEEEELLDDDSLAEEVDLEMRFAKEKIGREELDALSSTSDVGIDDTNSITSSATDDACSTNSGKNRPRRSKRKRSFFPEECGDINEDGNDESINGMQSSDIGTLDIANIVRGKRSRTKVDYRKLADAMFGDESDEDVKSAKGEYTYKPKKRNARKNHDDSNDDDGSDDVSDDDCDKTPEKKKTSRKKS